MLLCKKMMLAPSIKTTYRPKKLTIIRKKGPDSQDRVRSSQIYKTKIKLVKKKRKRRRI